METIDPADFLDLGDTIGGAFEVGFYTDEGGNRYSASASYMWQVSPSLSYKTSDDYTDGEGNTIGGSEYLPYTALAKGVLQLNQSGYHSIEASWMRFYSDQENISFLQTGFLGGAFGFIDRGVYDDTLNLTYRYTPEENAYIDLRITYGYWDILNEQRNVTAFGPGMSEWDTEYNNHTLMIVNMADLSTGKWESYSTAGLVYSVKGRLSTPAASFQPGGTTKSIGAYVQGELFYDNRLTLIPGARFDYDNQVAGHTTPFAGVESDYCLFSPKLAAHYQINDTFAVFGSIAHTEYAQVADMLYDTSSGNTGLTKEQSNKADQMIAEYGTEMAEITALITQFDGRPKVLFILPVRDGVPLVGGEGSSAEAIIELAGG